MVLRERLAQAPQEGWIKSRPDVADMADIVDIAAAAAASFLTWTHQAAV